MRILHTESSNGWGGQEIRILKEAMGMRDRGHEVILAVVKGGKLIARAKKEGFLVYAIDYNKWKGLWIIPQLLFLIWRHKIDLVNTHSSSDAWLGGMAGKVAGKKVIRTRHLSTKIKAGLNSRLLYNRLVDFVVTTSSGIIPPILSQAKLPKNLCKLIATGVEPDTLDRIDPKEVAQFRDSLGLETGDFLLGSVCVVRSWKGIGDLIEAASLLRDIKSLKWVIVGGGYLDKPKALVKNLDLEDRVFFTGHLDDPFSAMDALDAFTLLSTAHEGISQALLQAAYLKKPLIATDVGGSGEICRNEESGILIAPKNPKEVAGAALQLFDDPLLCKALGERAHQIVANNFTIGHTLDQMEEVYATLK